MKKRGIVILSAISLIVTLIVAILGYLVIQRRSFVKKENLSTEAGEKEVYKVAIEENEESKLNSLKAKEMNKNQNGVTIQQGNIVVYVDTALKIDSSIANYRTQYGIGETIVIKVYFDKEISSAGDEPSLYLKFGTGTERKVRYNNANGSELIFKYTIQEGDNGELKLTNLSGTVSDTDGNSIKIGLSLSGNVQYQDSSPIIAVGKKNKVIYSKERIEEGDEDSDNNVTSNKMGIKMQFNCKLYKKEDNLIKEVTLEDIKKIAKVIFTENGQFFDGKGNTQSLGIDEDLNRNSFIIRRIYFS